MLAFRIQLTLILMAFGLGAQATVVESLTLSRALELSSDIVIGQAMASESFMTSSGVIYTQTSVRVDEVLHGHAAPGAMLLVRELGGEVGSLGMKVEGVARFEVGENVLLFLEPAAGGEAYRTLGLFQGAYNLRELSGVTIATQKHSDGAVQAGGYGAGMPTCIPLGSFISDIAVAGAR